MPSRIGSSGMRGLPKWDRKAEHSKVVVASVVIGRDIILANVFTLGLSSL